MKIKLAGLICLLAGMAAGTYPDRGWLAKTGESRLAGLEPDSSKPGGALLPSARAAELRMTGKADAPRMPLSLWYRQPAEKWEEALPVGNGHMGAMVFGGVPTEHIQFNEHTVWTGQPHSYAHEGAVKALPEMRRLLQEMRQLEREAFTIDPKGNVRRRRRNSPRRAPGRRKPKTSA